jgi:hypothetical protein
MKQKRVSSVQPRVVLHVGAVMSSDDVKPSGPLYDIDQYDPDRDPIVGFLKQLYQAGTLGAYIISIPRAARLLKVPAATIDSWTKGKPGKGRIHLPVLEGLTDRDRLVFVDDLVRCYRQYRPRKKPEE